MNKRVLIFSFLMTIVATLLMSPLYLHHAFWNNWNEKRAKIEFFNQGSEQNSLFLNTTSKAVQVTYPEALKNVSSLDQSGQGMVMSFKVGPTYRTQRIVFQAMGDGKLFINFYPQDSISSYQADLKTGQVKFKEVFIGGQKIVAQNGFVKDLKDDEKISLIFKAKKYFDLDEFCQHIDWLMFIIVISLNFFVLFVVVRYLSNLKMIKKASRIDIVFISSFFVLLMLPLSRVSEDTVSEQENRVFSQNPRFFENGRLNYNYGKQFEQWFNDRFFGREKLIDFYNKVQSLIGGKGNKKVLIGRQNWLYVADSSVVSMYQNMNLFSENELKIVGEKMNKFVEDAHQHGVKDVYFYLSPDKETLYPEFYPTYISKQGDTSRLQQLIAFLKENYPQLKVLNFTRNLEKKKEQGELIFCKTGSHMTGIGSYLEYVFFMREIKKDYPMLKAINEKNTDIHEAFDCDNDLYRMLNDKKYSLNNAVNKTVIIEKPKAKIVNHHTRFNPSLGDVTLFENKKTGNNLHVLFATDSFGLRWKHFLAESFASVYNVFNAHGVAYTYFEDELEYLRQHKPDIIIVESTERFLQRFLSLEFPNI